MTRISVLRGAGVGLLALCLHTSIVCAAELKVLSTTAMADAWPELKSKFEASGHKINLVLAPSGALAKRVQDGEAADVIITTTSGLDNLTKEGKAVEAAGAGIAKSGIGIAVRKGTPKPDISTPEALKKSLLAATAIAYTDPASGGASGIYFVKVLERLGIADEMKTKTKFGHGGPTGAVVASGEAEIAVQQIPELMPVEGIEIVGPLPGDLQSFTRFSAGVLTSSKEPEAAKALIKFLQAPETMAVLKAKGFEPGDTTAPKQGS
jgi:molybdate transport system substrate-binding protein